MKPRKRSKPHGNQVVSTITFTKKHKSAYEQVEPTIILIVDNAACIQRCADQIRSGVVSTLLVGSNESASKIISLLPVAMQRIVQVKSTYTYTLHRVGHKAAAGFVDHL